jgi:hypothetical protein
MPVQVLIRGITQVAVVVRSMAKDHAERKTVEVVVINTKDRPSAIPILPG